MKDIRQGNDIRISWSIFKKDGQIFSLEGKNISLYLKSVFGRKELNDFVITGNIIQWTFYGKDQKSTGKYSLELVINEGEKGMITTDKCDFVNLVSCSCKLKGGEDAPNVETESIELTSTLEYVAGGGSYDDTALWRALDGKVDKVEGLGLSEENYTTEDKEKLEGLENYDDSSIKEELAKKAEKSEIPTKMSQLEQDIEVGSGYDDTEIRQELTELSAEVGKKQDTITDLETIRSGAAKGATAIQEVKTINGQSIVGRGNIEIQGGGGSGGDDTSLREAIFGKTTSKEFAINGYHAQTSDTLAVNIAQGEVLHFKLETLGAEITKYLLYVKYEEDAAQTSLLYFAPNEDYSFFAERPIVEFGVNTSSGWVTTKGNAKLSITQGGMTQPYNYMQLGEITIAENISELNVLDYIPMLLKFKEVKVYAQFTYSADRAKNGSIKLNAENLGTIAIDNLFASATNTFYIFDLTLDKNAIKAYIECHSNSFGNPQISDGNQGRNSGKLALGNPINTFIINLPLLAGDKLTFYGK